MKTLALIVATAAAALGTGAQAQTYSISGDFGGAMFTYGTGTGGSTFSAFSTRSMCQPNFDCFQNAGNEAIVLKNLGATTSGEIVIPSGGVHMHPGVFGGQDAIIRFTAAIAGSYDLSGAFARLNTTQSGDGVNARIFVNGTQLFSQFLAANSYGSSTAYSLSNIALGVGGTIDFVTNYNGAFQYDSTGIGGQISVSPVTPGGVPEPATWLMMILGFGAIGGVLRPRRNNSSVRVRFAG